MKASTSAMKSNSRKTFYRWLKFNLVGAIGVAVQLSTLALFNHFARGHYLLATIAALELTLLHNFVWHLHYTWRDATPCRPLGSTLIQLLRFHLSNGLISLTGNLLLMRLLVAQAHLPVLAANAIAILACSLANFLLSHYWIFAREDLPSAPHATSPGVLFVQNLVSKRVR